MNPAQRAAHYLSHKRRLMAWETYVRRRVYSLLTGQLNAVLVALRTSNEAALLTTETATRPEPLRKLLSDAFARVGSESARAEYNRLVPTQKADTPGLSVGFFSQTWVDQMRNYAITQAGNHVTSITDTTRTKIRETLAEAARQRLGSRETAKLLRTKVGSLNKSRAILIARTETTTAANYGTVLAAESSKLNLEKVWISTRDSRTRDSHRRMDGKRVAKGQAFEVNGKRMQYPGDPAGGAAEVIQCRCSMAHVPVRATRTQIPATVRPRVGLPSPARSIIQRLVGTGAALVGLFGDVFKEEK